MLKPIIIIIIMMMMIKTNNINNDDDDDDNNNNNKLQNPTFDATEKLYILYVVQQNSDTEQNGCALEKGVSYVRFLIKCRA